MRARTIVVAFAVGAFLMSATSVQASLWLTLDRTKGSPGELVRGATYPRSVTLAPSQSLPLYLAASSTEVSSPASPGLTPLAPLVIDADGTGTVTFPIPRVSAGGYTLWVHCAPCAASSGGRSMAPVGEITILSMPPTDAQPGDEQSVPASWPTVIAAVLAVAMLAGTFALVVPLVPRRRR